LRAAAHGRWGRHAARNHQECSSSLVRRGLVLAADCVGARACRLLVLGVQYLGEGVEQVGVAGVEAHPELVLGRHLKLCHVAAVADLWVAHALLAAEPAGEVETDLGGARLAGQVGAHFGDLVVVGG